MIGKLEASNKAALGDAAMQEVALNALIRRGMPARHRQQAILDFNLKVILGKSRHGEFDRESVLGKAFNIVRGISLRAIEPGCGVNHAGEAVKANHCAVKWRQICGYCHVFRVLFQSNIKIFILTIS